ncbi:MAG: CoA transferase [Saprospiraceae bacterium]|nr:CoA transferase [Saprospiraceae bacterium]
MFENLKVLELSSVLAGPLVGSFFSELGARVIKVENKNSGGDVTRSWKLKSEDPKASISAYYAAANYKKEVVWANLKDASDLANVHKLASEADIITSNFRSGVAEKYGLAYQNIVAFNPGVIYAGISGFSKEDPRPAFDVVLQAESGFMSMNGSPEQPPVKMPVALIDVLAAHHMKEAILIALIKKQQTGKGSHLNISLFDSAIASLANQATNCLMAGHIPQRMGTLHPNIAPYGDMFTTKDGKYLVLAVGNDAQFTKLATITGLGITNFETNDLRLQNRQHLQTSLQEYFCEMRSDYIEKKFLAENIPFGIVRNLAEVFNTPLANRMIIEEEIDGILTRRVKTALV